MGKFLMIVGIVIILLGAVLWLAPKFPWLGRLPGDILIKRESFTFYFPLATSLIISVILTLILYFWNRFK